MIPSEIIFETGTGNSITEAALCAVNLAKEHNKTITFIYNSIQIKVSPKSTEQGVINKFFSQAMSQPNLGIQTQRVRGA